MTVPRLLSLYHQFGRVGPLQTIGRFLTSSGVSAGIDMSLAVLARFFGLDVARNIARSTEYEWNEDSERDPFVEYVNRAVPFVDQLRNSFSQ